MPKTIKNLEFSLAFTSKMNETSNVSKFVAATPHYLESWGDFELKTGYFTLSQPTIRPLFNTQQFQDILLKLSGKTFLITGKLKGISRAEVKNIIENNSGKILSSVNKKLDYLVIGDKPTKKKVQIAKELKVKILKQSDWLKMLDKTS